MMFVLRSTYARAAEQLSLSRQAIDSMHRSINDYARDLKAANLELDQLRAALEATQDVMDLAQRQRDSALEASQEVVIERDRALAREREANQRANNAALLVTELEKKLGETERGLDMSRSRREQIGKDLDALRSETMDRVEQASTAIRWLLAHSSGGSEADAQAILLRKACESVENLLNT